MMRAILTALFFVLSAAYGLTQPNRRLDSLNAVLTRLAPIGMAVKSDTVYLQTLFELIPIEPSTTRTAAHLATSKRLIQQRRWRTVQPWQLLVEGIALFRQNQLYLSIDRYQDALAVGESDGASAAFLPVVIGS